MPKSDTSLATPTALYVIALLLVACAVIGTHALLAGTLAGSDADAAIINDSGWQRTHAERSVRLAGELMAEREADEIAALTARLGDSLTLMRNSHEELADHARAIGRTGPHGGELHAAYFKGQPSLDAMMRAYFSDIEAILAAGPDAYGPTFGPYRGMVALHRAGLVDRLDAVVHVREAIARERIDAFRALEDALLVVTLALLVAEALLIFRPLIGRLQDANRQLTEQNRVMTQMAVSDTLTKLPNRSGFGERLERLIDAQAGADRCAAVMMLDLDRFKNVNDKHGHPAGDRVLVEVGQRISAAVRDYDTVARLGGDEFAIILRKLDRPADARDAAERIIEAVCRPIMLREGEVSVGTSIGITIYPDDDGSPEELMQQADLALGQAKRSGKGCYRFYDPAMQEEVSRRHALASDLLSAFEQDHIKVYLQPILSLETGAVAFAESLIRWDDGSPGPLSASEFIAIIDEFQLAPRLERVVFEQVFAMLGQWQADALEAPAVTLNLSGADLRSSTFCERITRALQRYGLVPGAIALEIVESSLFDRGSETVRENVRRLGELGFRIILDDFGSGHASLTNLTGLPLHAIKIDRSLVQGAAQNEPAAKIASTVFSLARQLGIKTMAKGVETQEQLVWAIQQGCDYAQGYFFQAPVSLATFDIYLRNGVVAASKAMGLEVYRAS